MNKNQLKKQFSDHLKGIEKKEFLPLASLISLVLSLFLFSRVFGVFIINFLYVINSYFFALLIRDSWLVRKKNIFPLVSSALSLLMTTYVMIEGLRAVQVFIDMAENMQNYFQ